MPDSSPKLYEGLFLINQQALGGDLSAALDLVKDMLDRAGSEILSLRKWDERKLAYPIDGQKRGLYVLSLFKVNPVQIANIERDCNLSENVLRVLFTRGDHMGEVEINEEIEAGKDTQAEARMKAEDAPAAPQAAGS